jgi:mono/diheme cytochrome c family protein
VTPAPLSVPRLVVLGLLPLALACRPKPSPAAAALDAAPSASAAPSAVAEASVDGPKLVQDNCVMCHTETMLQQQHLTATQWGSVVKKMVAWGAPVEPDDVPGLVAYLAATHGPDAAPFVPETITAEAAGEELRALDDGVFAGGDAPRGRARWKAFCSPCHGEGARGQIGVNLVDRPILRRARDFAATVRKGRGRMTPFAATTDTEVADLLAYLRSLRPS